MGFLTSKEIAKEWNITSRRVTTLCKEGRVNGAIQKSGIWLIPENTEKPVELKRGKKTSRSN